MKFNIEEHQLDMVFQATRDPLVNTNTIAVVGLGYVGLPLAILAETRGYVVVGFDIDKEKISLLKKRDANFLSEEERNIFSGSRMRVQTNEKILADVGTYIICVPTPVHENHTPDLKPLEEACKSVGKYLKKGALVIVESTVNPGVCEEIALPILEKASGLKAEEDFFFAHCPERINPGDPRWNVRTIPRVIGASGPKSLSRATGLYRKLIEGDIIPMASIKEAEAVKMVENSFRDVNIAFVNELAMSFARAGIDIVNVIRGASSKPFAFMAHYPGCGVGGHCIPVDPYYLIRYGRQNGYEHRFLIDAREINNRMPQYTVDLLEQTLKDEGRSLRGATVALLGLSYKRDIPDMRESPALVIREELMQRGAEVRSFDPHVRAESSVTTLEGALHGAVAAIIATDHQEFRTLTPRTFLEYGVEAVIDGRNCLSKEAFLDAGLVYRGIGR